MGFNLSKPQVTGAGAGEGTVSPLKWLFRQEGLSFGGMGMASGRILYAWCGNRRATLARCVSVAAGQSYEAALVTYLGASQWERIQSVFVDEDGYIYVGGTTKSSNFPTTPGAYDRKGTGSGVNDGFVAKLSPDGTRLVWSTHLHGSQRDDVYGVWANSQGFVYVTGWTGSSDFPTTVGAYDRTHNGKNDVFLVKLTPDGSKFVYATLLGGSGVDQCRGGMSVDDSGRVYLSGYTDSVDFPVTSGAIQKTFQGGYGDAFVAQLSADGSSLLASTYFGGVAENGYEPSGICVDSGSNVHVGGSIFGSVVGHPTTSNAFQQRPTGEGDAFFAMLSPDLSVLMYSSFFGGVGDDRIRDLWLDPRDSIIFAGDTYSANLPTRPDVFQDAYVGNGDSYIAGFDPVVIRGAIVNRQ